MLNVAALFVAGTATLDETGAICATRVPTTGFQVAQIPMTAKVPVVLVVHARCGGDYDAELHVVCKDPAGVPRGSLQGSWHWPDEADKPSKYRCFTQDLVISVEAEGEYTIGAYYDPHGKIEIATPIPISISLVATSPVEDAGDDTNSEG
jgi:hypothetical protein